MSSLGSWIDLEGLAKVLRELCPDREDFPTSAPREFEDLAPLPHQPVKEPHPVPEPETPRHLVVVGRGLRESKAVVAGYPADEEVERVRTKLERIKAQARKSGLIQRPGDRAAAAPVPPPPESRTDSRSGSGASDSTTDHVAEGALPDAHHHAGGSEGGGATDGDVGGPFSVGAAPQRIATQDAGNGSAAFGSAEGDSPAAFRPSEGTMGVRLNAFAHWAAGQAGGADVFVIDAQGYPLVERGGDPDLLGAALLLCDASLRASGQIERGAGASEVVEGAVRNGVEMHLGSGQVLTVLPLETVYGMLCLGIHGPSPISRTLAPMLCEGLLSALGRR
ncbi:MAG TPA: hypothetical protein VMN39_04800 [Longimicrobiaceae bacterium]|nr:hypothetical protein [Longimicrobiaceae bacterium]